MFGEWPARGSPQSRPKINEGLSVAIANHIPEETGISRSAKRLSTLG